MVSFRSALALSRAAFPKLGLHLLLWAALCQLPIRAEDAGDALDAWLKAQTNLHSWSASFTQTRTLKTLTQPLIASGHVWFVAPSQFRWELGEPAQTIAVRQPEQLLIVYPRLQRAEKFPLTGNSPGPWRDALALFEAGFPRGRADLESKFKLLSTTLTNALCEVALEPRGAAARRLMPEFRLVFSPADQSLRATVLRFADGSILRNDFAGAVTNPVIPPERFAPEIPANFKITDLSQGGRR